MDALSTATATRPVPSLRSSTKPLILPNNNPPRLFKPTPQLPSNVTAANLLSAKPTNNSVSALPPKPTVLRSRSSRPIATLGGGAQHCSTEAAATGYAAALLDAAACEGALGAAARDARRLLGTVRAVLAEDAEEGAKGEAVREVAEEGRFYGKLVVLVRMLVRKGKVGVVGEVLEEVGRLWGQLYWGK